MKTPELEFDIDVAELRASPKPRRVGLLLAVLCAVSATMLLAVNVEPTNLAPVTAAVAPVAVIGPVAPPAANSEPAAPSEPVVELPEVEPLVVAEAPAAVPLAKRRLKARPAPHKNESSVRTMMKEGAFVLERTGAPMAVTEKVAVKVSVPKREVIRPAFDPAHIDLAMRDRAPAFRSCYESALKTNPTLQGNFDIRFTIDSDGAVQKASVRPHTKGPATSLPRCVKNILQRTRFGISPTATTVSRKLTFHRADATAPRRPLIVAAAFH